MPRLRTGIAAASLTLALFLSGCSLVDIAASSNSVTAGVTDNVLDESKLHTISVEVDEAALKEMIQTYLDKGDRYDLGMRRIQPHERKQRGQFLDPNAPGYKPEFTNDPFYIDMLGDTTLANAMGFLIDSNQKEVRGLSFDPKAPAADPLADLGFSFRLYKGKDSMGWYSDEQGADEYSVANLYLDIAPVRISRPLYAPWSPR